MDSVPDLTKPRMQLPFYLPTEGVTLDRFNSWKSTLMESLQQNEIFKFFLPGGLYCCWLPGSDVKRGQRIQHVHADDPGRLKQEDKSFSSPDQILTERNTQLNDFIEIINLYSNNCGRDSICDHSTSFDLIIQFLLECHNLEHKLGSLFELCHCKYSEDEDFTSFYQRFRATICDNLKKRGDEVKYLDSKELLEDEILSPTFEDVIILWCLEKIDPSLPMKVFRVYCSQLIDCVTIKDLQEDIFSKISQFLGEDEIEDFDDVTSVRDDSDFVAMEDESFLKLTENSLKSERIADMAEEDKNLNGYDMDQENDSFACNKCDLEFKTRIKLKKHRITHRIKKNEAKIHKCDLCEEEFSLKSRLRKHVKEIHETTMKYDEEMKNIKLGDHSSQVYKCNGCGKELKSKESLRYHEKKHANQIPSCVCPRCGMTLKHKTNLKRHLEICQVEQVKNMPCQICGKLFSSERNLQDHVKRHQDNSESNKDVKVFRCHDCGKDLKSRDSLRYHEMKHANKIPSCVCPKCGITVKHKTNLKRHLEICQVEQVRNMPCQICGKLFSNERNLLDHIKRLHESTKPAKTRDFPCETCHRTFVNEEERGSHVCKHFSCDICDTKFMREKYLKRHKLMHAGVTMFPCPLCEALFEKKKQLNGHKRITHSEKRDAKCEECHKTFKTNSALKTHMFAHQGEKPFKCGECGTAFLTKAQLKSHSMVHTKEYPHECDSCGSRFRDIKRLKKHREKQMCGVTSLDLYNKGEAKINGADGSPQKVPDGSSINFNIKILDNQS